MKALFAVAALLLTLPVAAAAPAGAAVDKETDTLRQEIDGISVEERIEFHVTDAAAYSRDADWVFQVQTGAISHAATVSRSGQEQSVNASDLRVVPGTGDFETVRVNLTGKFGGAAADDRFVVTLRYRIQEDYDHALSSLTAQLVVYAEPREGFEPVGQDLPAFFPTGERYHAVVDAPAQGTRFGVAFQPASVPDGAAGARDLTPYLWALAGLVIGFLVAGFFARRGAFGAAPKKFEKGGQMESREMLEARRRTMMAALKELEVAHEAKEIPDAAYAPLKEEYKAQTVKVMRSLEDKQERS